MIAIQEEQGKYKREVTSEGPVHRNSGEILRENI
jgi:hypothetical protein